MLLNNHKEKRRRRSTWATSGRNAGSHALSPAEHSCRRAGENTSLGAAGRPAGNRQADHCPRPARRRWRKMLHSVLKTCFRTAEPLLRLPTLTVSILHAIRTAAQGRAGPAVTRQREPPRGGGGGRDCPPQSQTASTTRARAARVLGQGPGGCSPHAPALRPGGCARGAAAGAGDACAGR